MSGAEVTLDDRLNNAVATPLDGLLPAVRTIDEMCFLTAAALTDVSAA